MREDPEGTVRSFPLNGPEVLVIVHCGGAGGGRTHYLFNAIEALSQLSYSPTVYGPGVRTGRPDRASVNARSNIAKHGPRPQ